MFDEAPSHLARFPPAEGLDSGTTHSSPQTWTPAWNGIRNDDVVAARLSNGLYELRQFVDDEFVMIRLGVFDRRTAEKATIELAKREQSNAWVQEGPTTSRLLDMWTG